MAASTPSAATLEVSSARPVEFLPLAARVAAELLLWAALLQIAHFSLRSDSLSGMHHISQMLTITSAWCVLLVVAFVALYCLSTPLKHPLHVALGASLLFVVAPAGLAACLIGYVFILYLVCGLESPRLRLLAFVALVTVFFWGIAAAFVTVPVHGWRVMLKGIVMLLLHNFFIRSAYWFYERSTGVGQPKLIQFLLYFLALPFTGWDTFTPSYSYMQEQQREISKDLVLQGLRTMRVWLTVLLVMAACCSLYNEPFRLHWAIHMDSRYMFALSYGGFMAMVFLNLVLPFFYRAIAREFAVGASRVLGWEVHNAYDSPLTAPTPAAFWRRWNVYWHEFLMAAVYMPVVLALARRYPRHVMASTVAACVATFLAAAFFDSVPFAFYLRNLPNGACARFVTTTVMFFAINGVLVGFSLLLERRRQRSAPPFLATPATFLVISSSWMLISLNPPLSAVPSLFLRVLGMG